MASKKPFGTIWKFSTLTISNIVKKRNRIVIKVVSEYLQKDEHSVITGNYDLRILILLHVFLAADLIRFTKEIFNDRLCLFVQCKLQDKFISNILEMCSKQSKIYD